jgi:hypothetical protein
MATTPPKKKKSSPAVRAGGGDPRSRVRTVTRTVEVVDDRPSTKPRSKTSKIGAAQESVQEKGAMLLPFPEDLWVEGKYVAPIAFLRSALFAVVRKGARKELKNEMLAAGEGTTITFTGTQLDQADEDVFLAMLHKAREHGLGYRVNFSMRSLLRELEWDTSGKSMTRLRDSFDRLFNCSVVIDTERVHYKGHLVDSIRVDKTDDDFYYFRLNAEMVGFFNLPEYVRIAMSDRKKIHGMLAKWLHAYIEVGPERVVATIDEIMKLSGSNATNKTRFRGTLSSALKELEAAEIIRSWKIEQNTVYVVRKIVKAIN